MPNFDFYTGFEDGFGEYNEDNDKFHEAGYDAYCTGFSFLKMASHLCKATCRCICSSLVVLYPCNGC